MSTWEGLVLLGKTSLLWRSTPARLCAHGGFRSVAQEKRYSIAAGLLHYTYFLRATNRPVKRYSITPSCEGVISCYFKSPHPHRKYSRKLHFCTAPAPRGAGALQNQSARRQRSGGGVMSDSILLTRRSGEDEYLLSGRYGFSQMYE